MKKMSITEIQKTSIEILAYIDKVCRENDINYSIFYGSLIGVERHRGYIPWDDDLDIVLLRPEYERLLELLAKQQDFLLLSPKTTKNYRYVYSKLVDPYTLAISRQYYNSESDNLGVFVDIFPLDGFPSSLEEREKFGNLCEKYRSNMMFTLNNSYAVSRSWWKAHMKRFLYYPKYKKILKQGDSEYWRNKYESLATKYPVDRSEYCGYLEFVNINWGVFPTEWFKHFENVEFEGYQFRAIKDRDKFLTLRYGDYMKTPPPLEQKTHHPYDFYWKE